MKAIKSWPIALAIILSLSISSDKVFAARIIISATSGIFSPNTVYASVGDTIIWWTYANSHTTTCIGTDGCSVLPAGAQPWDALLFSFTPPFTYVIRVPGYYRFLCTDHPACHMMGNIFATVTGINQVNEIAESLSLEQNFPNPFNPETRIEFSIPEKSLVSLKVFDGSGRDVAELVNEELLPGTHAAIWDASAMPAGVYFYRIQAGRQSAVRKMILLK